MLENILFLLFLFETKANIAVVFGSFALWLHSFDDFQFGVQFWICYKLRLIFTLDRPQTSSQFLFASSGPGPSLCLGVPCFIPGVGFGAFGRKFVFGGSVKLGNADSGTWSEGLEGSPIIVCDGKIL